MTLCHDISLPARGWTAERRVRFLDHLSLKGNVRAACARVASVRAVTTTDSPFFGVSPSEKPEEMETFITSWSSRPRPKAMASA